MRRTVSAGLLWAITVVPAAADWQYTKWGMTIAQVQAVSKGKMQPCDARCADQNTSRSHVQLRGEHRAGEFVFNAWMGFDSQGRLNQVSLTLLSPDQIVPLVGSMRAKYGESESGSRDALGTTRVWRDKTDQVTFMVIGERYAGITYAPRVTASSGGL